MPSTARSSVRFTPPLLALLCGLVLAAPAQGFVYWTDYAGDKIGRATLEGAMIDQSFIGAPNPPINPCGIAIDDEYIYWANSSGSPAGGKIGRAKLDGSEVDNELITGADNPCGVAVNASHVFWANADAGGTSIGRANLNGSEPNQTFIPGLDSPRGLAIDSEHVYWVEGLETIGRAALDGGEVDSGFIETIFLVPRGVAVDDQHIYWADANGKIGRANLDGSGIDESFITGASEPQAVDVNRKHIYWTNLVGDTIGRANIDGSGVDQSFIQGEGELKGVVATEPPAPPLFPAPLPPTEPAGLRLLKVVRDKKRGTARLVVSVSGPGTVRLAANRKIKAATRNAKAAGRLKLPLIPKGRARKQLFEGGRVKVLAKVTFRPAAGDPVVRRWRRALIRVRPGLR